MMMDWHLPNLSDTQNRQKNQLVNLTECSNLEGDSSNIPKYSQAHSSTPNEDGDEMAEADVMLAEPELAEPPMYAVVMYNDDYTPMDFVVFLLISEFRHTEDDAVQVMLNIHNQGKGIAGIYIKDIAETKASKANNIAQREGFPLMTQIEPHIS